MKKCGEIAWNPYPIRCLTASWTASLEGNLPERITRWCELELVLEGSGTIITEDAQAPAEKGMLFFRPPGVRVEAIQPYRSILIVFDLCYSPERLPMYQERDVLEGSARLSASDMCARWMRLKPSEPVRDWFEEFEDAYLSSSRRRWLAMKTRLLQILEYLWEQSPRDVPAFHMINLHTAEITALQNYIRVHVSEPFSLKRAAELCGLSEGFLCRVFRRNEGVSLVEYVNQIKISHAKRLLLETNLPLKAVVASAGFRTETYFYTLFRRLEGVTPTQYRDMHRSPHIRGKGRSADKHG